MLFCIPLANYGTMRNVFVYKNAVFFHEIGKPIVYAKPYFLVHFHGCDKSFGPASSWLRCDICKLVFTIFRLSASHSGQKSLRKYTSTYIYQQEFTGS